MTIDDVLNILAEKGNQLYGGEAVTQLEHALQAATLAEKDGRSAEIITACLLHDFGHLIHDLGDDPAAENIDDVHECRGEKALREIFPLSVLQPIKLHVDAKRYLCYADPSYHAGLSPASQKSLALQGGKFSTEEAKVFESQPHWEEALIVRKYDDLAKIPKLVTKPLEQFREALEACVKNAQTELN